MLLLSYPSPNNDSEKLLKWDLESLIDAEVISDGDSGDRLYATFKKGTCPVPEVCFFVDELEKWKCLLKKQKIKAEYHSDEFISEVALLLKSQSETYFDEIVELAKASYGYEDYADQEVVKLLRGMISNLEDVNGFVEKDKRRFIHKAKFERMRENVNINTNFDVMQNAAILIRCPYCGSPTPDVLSSPKVVCPSCNNTYLIPKRLFDIL